MSRRRKRQSRRRRGVGPVDIQVRGAGPDAVEEFFRFGGPSVFPCGCSAHGAVQTKRQNRLIRPGSRAPDRTYGI